MNQVTKQSFFGTRRHTSAAHASRNDRTQRAGRFDGHPKRILRGIRAAQSANGGER